MYLIKANEASIRIFGGNRYEVQDKINNFLDMLPDNAKLIDIKMPDPNTALVVYSTQMF